MRINLFLDYLSFKIDNFFLKIKFRAKKYLLIKYPNIHSSVKLGIDVSLIGENSSFYIGKNTYINNAIISTGLKAKVIIGKNCAIGYRVSIKAITHNIKKPCPSDDGKVSMVESEIIIGDFCWIGDNVFIREGVVLGNHVIVGANSVVTKSFPNNVTIAGVPAKIISKR